ncbi:conserved hypothetical protein [Desulfatibacillum aliphaticivorans]|uniref:Uncharacterized protein n=1 Tax=Desulfatibacillum aliphaticivorans TaxID=218208 RepID=B8FHH6_DESAL|nr:hypothetical protein [Desulfatibacillum aliphaticivorans]ACL02264.1 conserved hypothetical protein [Desulfatibacillum aliphaticivorans]
MIEDDEHLTELINALTQAKKRRILVQIGRQDLDGEDFLFHGFILDFSREHVLIQLISDRFDLDGYEVLRTENITLLDSEFEHRRFLERALGIRGMRPIPLEGIDLKDTRSMFRSVEKQFPLLVIHREWDSDGECEVGRIKMAADEFYTLKALSPTAEWVDDDKVYRYSDVTRVCFGGDYETTLARVAGIEV